MAGPTHSLLDHSPLSIFKKHFSFSFSQNEQNVYSQLSWQVYYIERTPKTLSLVPTHILLIILLLCQLQGSLLLCICPLPQSLTTETTIWDSLTKNTRHNWSSIIGLKLNTKQQPHFRFCLVCFGIRFFVICPKRKLQIMSWGDIQVPLIPSRIYGFMSSKS